MHALRELADRHGLKIHMDGARFANAVVALSQTPADLTWRAGVDVLCLGGTKNGMAVGEALVFFDKALATDFAYRCKQAGQLASKMRFIAAPWLGLLETGAWLRNARQANAMAAYLAERLKRFPGVRLMFPPQANSVFLELPESAVGELRARGWLFYTFIAVSYTHLDVYKRQVTTYRSIQDRRSIAKTSMKPIRHPPTCETSKPIRRVR